MQVQFPQVIADEVRGFGNRRLSFQNGSIVRMLEFSDPYVFQGDDASVISLSFTPVISSNEAVSPFDILGLQTRVHSGFIGQVHVAHVGATRTPEPVRTDQGIKVRFAIAMQPNEWLIRHKVSRSSRC